MISIMEKTKSGEGVGECLGKGCDFQWMGVGTSCKEGTTGEMI